MVTTIVRLIKKACMEEGVAVALRKEKRINVQLEFPAKVLEQ